MRVLGVDPGSHRTGWGVIDVAGSRLIHVASGTIVARGEMAERLHLIAEDLSQVIALHQPQIGAIEQIFHAKNSRSALLLGQARGAALVTLVQGGVSVDEYTPAEVKRMVAGSGRADKIQVQRMVCSLLGIAPPKELDTSDALAVAICHGLVASTPSGLKGAL